ncbi:MAG TPA: TAT-variant-translocated molybdopterin oxidoreductase [Tepidisphaeraceae bacterium]
MSQVDHHQSGISYWRGLEQLSDTPQVRELLAQEFPGYDPTSVVADPGRRQFLKIMGASMALAGLTLTGCRRWPQEHLAPYSANPSGHVPGFPEQYATAWELGGVAHGLLVTSYDGRPIKIEGNPSHPSSWTIKGKQGSADAFAQASILEMYDPERSRLVIERTAADKRGKNSDWEKFDEFATVHFGRMKGQGGGFAILSEATSSPSVLDMRKRLLAVFPQAKWYEYEPLTRDAELEASRQAFGKALRPVYGLDKAKVIVSLDADLLGTHPNHVRYAADWSEGRRSGDRGEMNRVYCAETCFSITGTVADVRLAVDPARIDMLARALASKLGVAGVSGQENLSAGEQKFIEAAAGELNASGGSGVVAVGHAAPVAAHVLAFAINQQIGAVGKTVTLIDDPAGDRPTHVAAITGLAKDMAGGKINTLLILGGNPAYDAPLDADFANALGKVAVSIHLATYDDETSRLCKWHLPRAHYLEAWGDGRSWDGTAGVVQPLIEPLFGGKSAIEVLAMLSADKVTAGDQIVRRTWREQFIKGGGNFERQYRKVLEVGFLEGSQSKPVQAQPKVANLPPAEAAAPAGTFFLKFEPDAHVYDGRFANNGWLQETHEPLSKLVWDNAAVMSVKDANTLGIETGDVIKLEGNNRWIEAAAYVLPGQPVGVIGLSLGYGRTAAGPVGDKLGFNGYTMRTSDRPWIVGGVKVSKTGQDYRLVTASLHHLIDRIGMNGREQRVGGKNQTGVIVREASLSEFKKDPSAPHEKTQGRSSLQLFDPLRYNGPHAWGMAVDLNTCIGCNACVVACQAENNIPVVGKDQAFNHREMHWIRIDRYFKGASDDPQIDVIHQPMLCVHCENAPCEQVCPVAATMHDTEGLNVMVYNRCIGTRYCSNNCPYKVRRFNYFDWHAKPPRKSTGVLWPGMPDSQQLDPKSIDPIRRMQFNPEVTVRMRGVMEKCTYCTQRIQRTKIARRNAGEDVRDGDIITACQQACPTQAIVFGDLRDRSSRVVALQNNPRSYDVLGELNTRPRTRHLAKLRNRDEAQSAPSGQAAAEHHAQGPSSSSPSPSQSPTLG